MSANAAARLSSGTLVPLVLASLPENTDGPDLRSPWDAIALLSHSCLLSVDFRLVGLGEDDRIEASSDAGHVKPLPTEWNESRSSDFAFRYRHPQSSLEYLLKIGKLGGKAVISGLGIGDDQVRSFDITVADYVSRSSFPFTRLSLSSEDETKRSLAGVFISEGRIADFSALFKLKIIQALVPGLHKPGYEEVTSQSTEGSSNQSARDQRRDRHDRGSNSRPPPSETIPPLAQPRPFDDPLAVPPRRPFPAGDFPPPGFEDEHQILRPPGRGGFGGAGMPMSGERDLYPPGMGPNDPLRIGPRGGPRGGGGMYPTPDDPMFGGPGGFGGGYDHQAPPGARYDPVGPHDGPPNLRGGRGFRGGPGAGFGGPGGPGGPRNPFGGFGDGDFI